MKIRKNKYSQQKEQPIANIPKHYLQRTQVPPKHYINGKWENEEHYRCKIYIAETIRDRLPLYNIEYEYKKLPYLDKERKIQYMPDIFITYNDMRRSIHYVSDVEINGKIHYKNKKRIKANKMRMMWFVEHFKNGYRKNVEPGYNVIWSYIIIDTDDFKTVSINEIFETFRYNFLNGGVHPLDTYKMYDSFYGWSTYDPY